MDPRETLELRKRQSQWTVAKVDGPRSNSSRLENINPKGEAQRTCRASDHFDSLATSEGASNLSKCDKQLSRPAESGRVDHSQQVAYLQDFLC